MTTVDIDLTELVKKTIDDTVAALEPIVHKLKEIKILGDVLMKLQRTQIPLTPPPPGTKTITERMELPKKKRKPKTVLDHYAIKDAIVQYVTKQPDCSTTRIMRYLRALKVVPSSLNDTELRSVIRRDVKEIPSIAVDHSRLGQGTELSYRMKSKPVLEKQKRAVTVKPVKRAKAPAGSVSSAIKSFILDTLPKVGELTPPELTQRALEQKISFGADPNPNNLMNRMLRRMLAAGEVTRRTIPGGRTGEQLIYSVKGE